MEQTIPRKSWKKRSCDILSKLVKWPHSMDLKRRLGMMSCIWRHRQLSMILFTYLCSKICLLLNTPAPVGTTLRSRRNSRRFEADVPEKKIHEYNYAWLIRDSEAGNIKKQLWLRIPKGINICHTRIYILIVHDLQPFDAQGMAKVSGQFLESVHYSLVFIEYISNIYAVHYQFHYGYAIVEKQSS